MSKILVTFHQANHECYFRAIRLQVTISNSVNNQSINRSIKNDLIVVAVGEEKWKIQVVVCWLFLACEDFEKTLDHPFLACA